MFLSTRNDYIYSTGLAELRGQCTKYAYEILKGHKVYVVKCRIYLGMKMIFLRCT